MQNTISLIKNVYDFFRNTESAIELANDAKLTSFSSWGEILTNQNTVSMIAFAMALGEAYSLGGGATLLQKGLAATAIATPVVSVVTSRISAKEQDKNKQINKYLSDCCESIDFIAKNHGIAKALNISEDVLSKVGNNSNSELNAHSSATTSQNNKFTKLKTKLNKTLENKKIKLTKNLLTNFGNQILPSISAILSFNPVGLVQILTTQTFTSLRNLQKITKEEQQQDELQKDINSKKSQLGFTREINLEELAEQSLSLRATAKALKYILDKYPSVTENNITPEILKEFQRQIKTIREEITNKSNDDSTQHKKSPPAKDKKRHPEKKKTPVDDKQDLSVKLSSTDRKEAQRHAKNLSTSEAKYNTTIRKHTKPKSRSRT